MRSSFVCPRCHTAKPPEGFYANNPYCRECTKEQRRQYRSTATHRWAELKRLYGWTEGMFRSVLKKQGGACVSCGRPHVDAPRTRLIPLRAEPSIRALFCGRCAVAIGMMGSDRRTLQRTVAAMRKRWR